MTTAVIILLENETIAQGIAKIFEAAANYPEQGDKKLTGAALVTDGKIYFMEKPADEDMPLAEAVAEAVAGMLNEEGFKEI